MDERRDPGEFYPGGRVMVRPDVAPPQVHVRWSDISGKPDFSDVAPLGAADSLGTVKETMNTVVNKLKTSVFIIAACMTFMAAGDVLPQTAALDDIPGNRQILTNTQEYVDAKVAATTNALDSSLSSRLSQVSRSAADYTDATIAAATNAIPQPDLSSCVRTDENGAATLKYHGNNEGAIDIVPGSGGTPYPLISVKNPNYTEARIRVGAGDGEDFRGILIDDTPNQGRRIRIDGNYSDNIDIGYDYAFVPHIIVNGTNILPVVFAAAESNSVHAAAIAEMLGQIADVAEMASSERSWNRPGDWGLSYLPELSDVTVSSMSIVTNDCGMILSNSTQGATQGLSARIYAENVDPTSQTEPPTIVSLEVAGGFASNNVVTVTSNGNFHVKGIASNGEAREAVVSFSGGTSTAKNYSIYIADSPAFVSRMVTQNFVVGALEGMELAESGTDGSRNAYNFYTANYPQFGTGPAQGHFRPFAIAPKLMATAAHYPWFPAADGWSRPVTYYYHDGTWANTYTVKGNGTHFNLATWALTNGFTQAEVAAAGISDTEILPLLDGWNFPAEECPYFATPEWVAANYGSLYGMTIWAQTQKSIWCIPCTVSRVVNGGIGWQTPSSITPGSFRPRVDIAALVGDYNALDWWRVQTGDSGKPLFLENYHEGSVRHIVVSHFHSVGGGPNYVAASRILAKLCQHYNTTIKLLQ